MLYMFLLYFDPALPMPDDVMERHLAVAATARSRNAYVCSEALGGAEPATTIRVREGNVLISDGPFAETKEVLGGFYILDCKDLDEAVEYAEQIPDTLFGAVEVRPVLAVPGWQYTTAADRVRLPMQA